MNNKGLRRVGDVAQPGNNFFTVGVHREAFYVGDRSFDGHPVVVNP